MVFGVLDNIYIYTWYIKIANFLGPDRSTYVGP